MEMEHHAKYCVKSQFLNVVLEISIASIPKISNVDMIKVLEEFQLLVFGDDFFFFVAFLYREIRQCGTNCWIYSNLLVSLLHYVHCEMHIKLNKRQKYSVHIPFNLFPLSLFLKAYTTAFFSDMESFSLFSTSCKNLY